jgi:hypothetical protein
VLLLLLAACVLLPNIPCVAARPAQTTPPRKVVVTTYLRASCKGFTTGTLSSCDPSTHEAACCEASGKICMSVPGGTSLSFATTCNPKSYKDLGCCPLTGVTIGKVAIWNEVACPGKRVAPGPKPPQCPAQTMWACCVPPPKGQVHREGAAWTSGCTRILTNDSKDCSHYPTATYGCCPM